MFIIQLIKYGKDAYSILKDWKKLGISIFCRTIKVRRWLQLYVVRPKPGATVSTPLDWKEVNAKLNPADFTIKTIQKRLDKAGDLWKPVLAKGQDILNVLKKMQAKE
ncbi:hypothetical protein BH11BAC7_BH11BAC7_10220 [soil metagenome]